MIIKRQTNRLHKNQLQFFITSVTEFGARNDFQEAAWSGNLPEVMNHKIVWTVI